MRKNIRQRLFLPRRALQDHPFGVRVLLELCDLLVVVLSLLVVAGLYRGEMDWGLVQEMTLTMVVACLGFLLAADLMHLYRSWRWNSIGQQVLCLWAVWIIVSLIMIVTISKGSFGRGNEARIFYYWLWLTPVGLALWRVSLYGMVRRLRSAGMNTRSVVVVGSCAEAVDLARQIVVHKQELGIRFLGLCDSQLAPDALTPEITELGYVGGPAELLAMAASGALDVVYLALPFHRETEIRELIDAFADTTVSVHVLVPELFEPMLYNVTREFGPYRTVGIFGAPFEDRLNAKLKRMEDLVLSLLLLAVALVPMLIIALVLRVSSSAPVLFKQNRYGLGGNLVEVWKFRTMRVIEADNQIVQSTRDDPRITRFGSFLRRFSLDELPQLINVLQGSMSLVGPRPHAVDMNETYRKLIKFYMLRHSVKPGITGWAQVNGLRGETEVLGKMEKRVEYDLFYIRNWSLFFDLKILILTVFHIFGGKNAY